MKIPLIGKRVRVFLLLLIISVLLNISSISFYFLKLKPYISELEISQKTLTKQEEQNCQNGRKVYSLSQKKVICLTEEQTRTQALSECSKKFSEMLSQPSLLKGYSITEVQKLKDFVMEVCMEARGYEY